jgi:hypothetical protein
MRVKRLAISALFGINDVYKGTVGNGGSGSKRPECFTDTR